MTKFLILACSLVVTAPAFADTLNCGGHASLPGGSVSGSCNNGNCSGSINGGSISVQGTCTGGENVTFRATGYKGSEHVWVNCRNGFFNGQVRGGSITLNGSCSNGGSFYGSIYQNSKYISGSCSENGWFNAHVGGDFTSFNGNCIGGNPL